MADNGNIGADCHERSSEGESASRCSLGERLKRERESRNITLQEMSESTKIALPNFKAIEDDDFAKLPGGLYNTGCIRAYAQFIGLDPEPVLRAYVLSQRSQESAEENSKPSNVLAPSAASDWVGRRGPSLRPQLRTWILVPCAIIIVGVGGWSYLPKGDPLEAASSIKISGTASELKPLRVQREVFKPEPDQAVRESSVPPSRTQRDTTIVVEGKQRLSIMEFGVGNNVVNHQLQSRDEYFEEGSRIWFWTRAVGGEAGDRIWHVWLHENRKVDSIQLGLGDAHWRTQSRKTLHPGLTGRWAVEARDRDGRVLARQEFTCVKKESVSGPNEDNR